MKRILFLSLALAAVVLTIGIRSRPQEGGLPGQPGPAPTESPREADIPERVTEKVAPAGLTQDEWDGVLDQIRAEQRAFQSGPDQHLFAAGTGGERLSLSPDGTATVSLGEKQRPVDLASGQDQVVKTAAVAADSMPVVDLSLRSLSAGRNSDRQSVAAAPATAKGKHLAERILGRGLTEWWRSDERGFEFGWNVDRRPDGDERLRMEMAVECPWPGAVESGGGAVAFADPAGSGWRLACRGLVAKDANGRELPATLSLAGGTLSIEVDDTDASYPVVIDPWIIAEAPVTVNAPAPETDGHFGYSIALGGDTLAVTAVEEPGIGTPPCFPSIFSRARAPATRYGGRSRILRPSAPSSPGSRRLSAATRWSPVRFFL